MAFDDSGDEAQRDAVFLIDSGDTEADRIQSAGHVDGTIELSLGIDAHLKADEEHAVFHAGNDTEIVGVGSDLLQGCPIGILRCLFDGEVDRIDIPLLVVRNIHDPGNDQVAGGVQIRNVREPFPGDIAGIDLSIHTASFHRHGVVADTQNTARHQDTGLYTAGNQLPHDCGYPRPLG